MDCVPNMDFSSLFDWRKLYNVYEWSPVCNHTSDNKIGRPCSGSPICLSRVWLQTELDDTKSYHQLIIEITISEKNSQVVKKGESSH